MGGANAITISGYSVIKAKDLAQTKEMTAGHRGPRAPARAPNPARLRAPTLNEKRESLANERV